jgi:hypothetical protein
LDGGQELRAALYFFQPLRTGRIVLTHQPVHDYPLPARSSFFASSHLAQASCMLPINLLILSQVRLTMRIDFSAA